MAEREEVKQDKLDKFVDHLNEPVGYKSEPDYPCPDNIDPAKWATKSDDHKKAYLNINNKGGPK